MISQRRNLFLLADIREDLHLTDQDVHIVELAIKSYPAPKSVCDLCVCLLSSCLYPSWKVRGAALLSRKLGDSSISGEWASFIIRYIATLETNFYGWNCIPFYSWSSRDLGQLTWEHISDLLARTVIIEALDMEKHSVDTIIRYANVQPPSTLLDAQEWGLMALNDEWLTQTLAE